jgi:hypothetical protein
VQSLGLLQEATLTPMLVKELLPGDPAIDELEEERIGSVG